MPKSFSTEESLLIRDSLHQTGKALFSSQGLRKTSIDEIVQAVGIAKGSFYKFYPSKEMLYLSILEQEEQELRESLNAQFLKGDSLSQKTLISFFQGFVKYLDTEPLFLKMFEENALDRIMRKLPPERLEEHMKNDSQWFDGIFENWQEQGYLQEMPSEVFASLMRGIFILFTQKNIMGEAHFEAALTFLFESLALQIIQSGRPL